MICNRRRKVNFIDPYARRYLTEAKMPKVCFRGRFRSTAAWCLIRCEANPPSGEAVQPTITALGGLCSPAWRLSSGQPFLLRRMMNPVSGPSAALAPCRAPARMQLCRRCEVAETGLDDVAPPLCRYSRPQGPQNEIHGSDLLSRISVTGRKRCAQSAVSAKILPASSI